MLSSEQLSKKVNTSELVAHGFDPDTHADIRAELSKKVNIVNVEMLDFPFVSGLFGTLKYGITQNGVVFIDGDVATITGTFTQNVMHTVGVLPKGFRPRNTTALPVVFRHPDLENTSLPSYVSRFIFSPSTGSATIVAPSGLPSGYAIFTVNGYLIT